MASPYSHTSLVRKKKGSEEEEKGQQAVNIHKALSLLHLLSNLLRCSGLDPGREGHVHGG